MDSLGAFTVRTLLRSAITFGMIQAANKGINILLRDREFSNGVELDF